MLSQSQITQIRDGIATGWNLLAGDIVTAVMKSNELALNGNFDSATGWDTNDGWTYSSVNKNITHDTSGDGNTSALEYSPIQVFGGATYTVGFTVSDVTTGSVSPAIGGVSGTAVSSAQSNSQQIVAGNQSSLMFVPTVDFNGTIDSVSCQLVSQSLLTIAYDYETGNRFAEGLDIDNAGSRLHDAREMTFLSTYLTAQGVDLSEISYWLINGERWDFIVEAPVQTALVPIAGIHNLVVLSVRKAIELEQTQPSGSFTFV
jgi:hypothetical protein